ncbi:MAG: ABC transporter permease [Nitrospinae bacterium]|nr:ABC transporter permease [Nitrospinota bacterium]
MAAMGLAGFIMVFYASLLNGFSQKIAENSVGMSIGDIQIHAEGYRNDPDLYKMVTNHSDIISQLSSRGLAASPRLYGFGLAATGSTSAGVRISGIDPVLEATVTNLHQNILEGSWLDPSDPKGVVIGKKLARTLNVDVGGEVVMVSQASDGSMANDIYRVRGILKSVGEGIDRGGFYLLNDEFRSLMVLPEGVHEIAIKRLNESSELFESTAIVSRLAPGFEVLDWHRLQPIVSRMLETNEAGTLIMLIITYSAVSMVILNAMLMSVFERIHEFGIMRAVGVTPMQVFSLIFTEAMLQALAASLLTLAVGVPVSLYYQTHGIDMSSLAGDLSFGGVAINPIWYCKVTPSSILIPIIFLFLITALAVLYPAIKAAVIQPVKAIYHR